ncbi:MAG TPA: phage major capsid protein [Bryobacteraceae bacterium]|nr:phage major capsid protein [Bryobacteraceae bacterium]
MASPIAQRITDAQERINTLKDQLTEHLASVDDSNVTDDQLAVTHELNEKIGMTEKSLVTLQQAEQRLATTVDTQLTVGSTQPMTVRNARPFAVAAQKVEPKDYVFRGLAIKVLAHCDEARRPAVDILKERYGEDDATKAVFDVVNKSASAPADTVTSGWASQLVTTAFGEFFQALMPNSMYPALAAKGGSFTFGRNGTVTLPTRSATPTISGSFIAQGAPIPVKQGAFTSVSLTPKKMGVISTFTREIALHSTPDIEAMIREAIVEDTAVAIDTVLIDTNAATTTRPAGLLNGISTQTPAGTSFANMVTDLRNLVGALITGTKGNVRNPVWLMQPGDKLAIALMSNANGEFPFKAELAAGTLLGYPVVTSTTMTADTIVLLDAADFVTATGDVPNFSVSDQAVLHMEDTSPLAISTTTTAVAAPVRSLWQTDSIGIRMIMDINWAMRRTGVVALLTSPTWN